MFMKLGGYLILFSAMVFVIVPHTSKAQDVAFSQFMSNPLYLNPALSGLYNGTYRLAGSYRDQWLGALDHPYRTFSFSGDMNFDVHTGLSDKPDRAAFGFLFVNDRTNYINFNANQIAAVGAYHKYLGDRYEQYLGIGFQFGLVQNIVNFENLNFGDEFNAIDGYTLVTSEDLPTNSLAVLDFKVGLNYTIEPDESSKYLAGIAYGHFTSPNISFYQDDDSQDPALIKKQALPAKWTGYIAAEYNVGFLTKVQPRIAFFSQERHQQLILGSNQRFTISKPDATYFHVGPWFRLTNDIEGVKFQSIILSVAYERKDFIVGLSYDHGVQDLITDRAGLNTLELSIQYYGETEDEEDICPKF